MLETASDYAQSVDFVMLLIVGISVVLLLGITVAMIYFVFRYSRKRHPVAKQIHGNVILEIIWIVIPTIIVMIMFWYGYEGYQKLRADSEGAYEVKVYGFMWGWNFEYPNGKKTDTLYIPLSQKTKLVMTSRDVLHSLYIPAFRLKEDLIGGISTFIILEPSKTGSFDIACAEYCGLNHSRMYTKLHVLEDSEFDEWLLIGMPEEEIKDETDTDIPQDTVKTEALAK
jgi:cytochrome c oxidase subunit II